MAYRRRKRSYAPRGSGRGRRSGNNGKRRGMLFLLLFIAVFIGAAWFFASPNGDSSKTGPQHMMDTILHKDSEEKKEAMSQSQAGKAKSSSSSAADTGNKIKAAVEKAMPSSAGNSSSAAAATPSGNGSGKAGKIAVCIDDAGRDLASQRVYEGLGVPLTLAVMPNQSHTRDAALEWHSKGLPVIIHQPMESVSGSGMEPIVILTSMGDSEIRSMLRDSMNQIPEAIGMNNHQGSKATIDRRVMNVVMSEMASHNMFFLDSATNSNTAVAAAAEAYGVRHARNELFVDNDSDVSAIEQMIRKGADIASRDGSVIIIGHCRPNTAEAFRQMVPKLTGEGYEFVYLSSMMH